VFYELSEWQQQQQQYYYLIIEKHHTKNDDNQHHHVIEQIHHLLSLYNLKIINHAEKVVHQGTFGSSYSLYHHYWVFPGRIVDGNFTIVLWFLMH
jgi:hypothetical protein